MRGLIVSPPAQHIATMKMILMHESQHINVLVLAFSYQKSSFLFFVKYSKLLFIYYVLYET